MRSLESGFVNNWFGLGDKAWFADRWSALAVIIMAEVWKTTPFISLLLLAGLSQVPEELQEAAKVDGATAWQRLRRVTIPNMLPAIMVALLFRTLDAFRIFDTIFIMTGGAEKTRASRSSPTGRTSPERPSGSAGRCRCCCSCPSRSSPSST